VAAVVEQGTTNRPGFIEGCLNKLQTLLERLTKKAADMPRLFETGLTGHVGYIRACF
jgi:hypothetical protein